MFSFCTEFLKYSAGAAQRRIESMRLLNKLEPKVQTNIKEKLEEGALNLSHLSQVSKFIRTQAVKSQPNMPLSRPSKLPSKEIQAKEVVKILKELENTNQRECEKKLVSRGMPLPFKREQLRRVSEEESRLSINLDEESLKNLESFMNLTAHQNPWASKEKAIKLALKMAVQVLAKKKGLRAKRSLATSTAHRDLKKSTSVTAVKNKSQDAASLGRVGAQPAQFLEDSLEAKTKQLGQNKKRDGKLKKRSRYIPADIQRQVWQRDQGKCCYVDPISHKTCGSYFELELDHVKDFAKGGGHEAANLRLFCSKHNRNRSLLERC